MKTVDEELAKLGGTGDEESGADKIDNDSFYLLSSASSIAAWIMEQEWIASRVLIPEDGLFVSDSSELGERFTIVQSKLLSQSYSYSQDNPTNSSQPLFGGLDISFDSQDESKAVAVYVVLDAKLQIVYQDIEYCTNNVPYVPTFLAFRELPPLLRLVEKQRKEQPEYTPTVLFVDGNGIWHPRRAGLACFVGVQTGLRTIGIGKNFLCIGGLTKDRVKQGIDESMRNASECLSSYVSTESTIQAKQSILFDKKSVDDVTPTYDDTLPTNPKNCNSIYKKAMLCSLLLHCIGLAIPITFCHEQNQARRPEGYCLLGHGCRQPHRSNATAGVSQPIHISVGHNISLRDSVVLSALLAKHRVPEPIRQADLIGRDWLRQMKRC
jgi:deoxyinosine 3'endonuclease (endonuclease V)